METCHIFTAGWWPYRSATTRAMRVACCRITGELTHHDSRLPCVNRRPSASTGSISGCARCSHTGGAALGVARSTPIPASCSRSRTRSSQPKSNTPSAGSSSPQEKMPTLTSVTPASRMSAMSSAQTSSGHCSGL